MVLQLFPRGKLKLAQLRLRSPKQENVFPISVRVLQKCHGHYLLEPIISLENYSALVNDNFTYCYRQPQTTLEYKHYFPKQNAWNYIHYYRIGLCSRTFVPVTFGPGTKGGFCPGSNGQPGQRGGTGPFCPGWSHQPGQKALLLSRLVLPTQTKGPST